MGILQLFCWANVGLVSELMQLIRTIAWEETRQLRMSRHQQKPVFPEKGEISFTKPGTFIRPEEKPEGSNSFR